MQRTSPVAWLLNRMIFRELSTQGGGLQPLPGYLHSEDNTERRVYYEVEKAFLGSSEYLFYF